MYDMSGKALEIKTDIFAALPLPPADDPSVRRKPVTDFVYDSERALCELKEALKYIPEEFHEQAAPEFLEEYKKYGHIYGFRFRPHEKIKAKPLSEYRGNCLEGKVMQKLLDSALDTDTALYPYELVSSGGKVPVCRNWMQYGLLKKYLSIVTEALTLVIENGRPAGLFKSSPTEPRIVITEKEENSSGTSWFSSEKENFLYAFYTSAAKSLEDKELKAPVIFSEYGENLKEQIKAAEMLDSGLVIISESGEEYEEIPLRTDSCEEVYDLIKSGQYVLFTGKACSLYEYILTQDYAPDCIIGASTAADTDFYRLFEKRGTKVISVEEMTGKYFLTSGCSPFTWYCLSESEEDLKATTEAVCDCIDLYRGNQIYDALKWLRKAKDVKTERPGRSVFIDEETAMLAVSKLNDMVKNGETGPLLVTDASSSSYRYVKAPENGERELSRFAAACSGGAGIVVLSTGSETLSSSGIVLDGSEKTDRLIRNLISRNKLSSFISAVWNGEKDSCGKAGAFNKKRSDGHIAIPYKADEEKLKKLLQ